MEVKNPKAFISYSWSSPDNEQKVLNLASELRESGIDVILDKWDLKEGHDAIAFMEKMVTDTTIKKVILICDKAYAEKANSRKGGVGTEAQIVSKELYDKTEQSKFVAVVVEKDEQGKAFLPVYYRNRIYIDLSADVNYIKSYEQLIRWVFDKPLYPKPEVGSVPSFLNDGMSITINTNLLFRQVVDSIKNQKDNRFGIIEEYFKLIHDNFEKLRINYEDKDSENFDDLVVENINNFTSYRNEFIEIINLLNLYNIDETIINIIHKYFESIIPFLFKPEDVRQWREWDFDNYKFIIQELFMYFIAILLKKEKFELVSKFLYKKYYYGENEYYGKNVMLHFSVFRKYLVSFEHRNKRLNLGRLSVKADILKERSQSSGISFNYLMQADFVLFIKGLFDCLISGERNSWFPDTLLYTSHWPKAFEIFGRSESSLYFNDLKVIFSIDKKEDFTKIFELLEKNSSLIPKWQFDSIDIYKLLNYENLCTIP